MNGIDILNKDEILTSPEWITAVLCISVIILLISFMFFIVFLITGCDIGVSLSGGAIIVSMIIGSIFNFVDDTYHSKPTGRYRYEAAIDDSVSITEVYDHYNVVEQRGDIWILEDKEDVDE